MSNGFVVELSDLPAYTTGSVIAGASNPPNTVIAGEGLLPYRLVFNSSNSLVLCDSETAQAPIGLTLTSAKVGEVPVLAVSGAVITNPTKGVGSWNFIIGDNVWLTSGGRLSAVAPTGPDDLLISVGVATASDTVALLFNPI